jgi:integrase
MTTPKPADPIRDIRDIRAIKDYLKSHQLRREYLYFVVAVNSGLRVGDLLTLTVDSLWDTGDKPRKKFVMHTQKTGAFIVSQINRSVVEAMEFAAEQGAKNSVSLFDPDALLFPVTRQTVRNWLKAWCHVAGLDEGNYSAHTTRKTCAYMMWSKHNKTFEALLVVSKALGHKSVGQTQDYLGINRQTIKKWQDDLEL